MNEIQDADLMSEKSLLTTALVNAKVERKLVLQKMQSRLHNVCSTGTLDSKESSFPDNAAIYTKINRAICDMEKDLDNVNLELVKRGHYDGDAVAWSKAMKVWISEDVCTWVATLCGVGAAFTYTTIFSATRGSIGFMCWAFVLYLTGLVLPMGIRALLSVAETLISHFTGAGTQLPPSRRQLKLAESCLSFIMLIGYFSAASAVFITLIPLYGLQYSPITSGASATTLLFTNSPRNAFWLAMSITSFIYLIYSVLYTVWYARVTYRMYRVVFKLIVEMYLSACDAI
ncbi:hypothetical protein F5887DRAFT_996890 [Amanita rubescens]|nr:hypothetical protein F5887DRAFT_996890 [Amanita rubescens]